MTVELVLIDTLAVVVDNCVFELVNAVTVELVLIDTPVVVDNCVFELVNAIDNVSVGSTTGNDTVVLGNDIIVNTALDDDIIDNTVLGDGSIFVSDGLSCVGVGSDVNVGALAVADGIVSELVLISGSDISDVTT